MIVSTVYSLPRSIFTGGDAQGRMWSADCVQMDSRHAHPCVRASCFHLYVKCYPCYANLKIKLNYKKENDMPSLLLMAGISILKDAKKKKKKKKKTTKKHVVGKRDPS